MNEQKHLTMIVGSYAEAHSSGMYAYAYDVQTGHLHPVTEIGGLKDPTFLALDAANHRIYTIAVDEQNNGVGLIVSYQYDPGKRKLEEINREVSVEASTCHISMDKTKQCLIVSSYHAGLVGLSPLLPDRRVGKINDVHKHEGQSIRPAQTQARAHSAIIDPTNRYVVVSDLGADKLVIYKLDADQHKLTYHHEVSAAPGAGPRHFIFHPSLPYAYVINELNATVTAYAFDQEAGILTEIETVPTLPASYTGDNSCADIHISPDGRFLYGSNRGHDSIVVYAIDETSGKLSLVQHVSCEGEHPRNFTLSPDGRFLLAANRDTNNITVFARDADTGQLQFTGTSVEVSRPVCLKFMV